MKLTTNLFNKIQQTAKKKVEEVTPTIKREAEKVLAKGKANVVCSIIDGVEVVAMGVIMLSLVAKPAEILGNPKKDDNRNIYMVYNEVHVTNNYYSKGDK